MVFCTCGAYGTDIHAVLFACCTCFFAGVRYYVYAWCCDGIMTCVLVILHSVYVYVLCCIVLRVQVYVLYAGVGVCVMPVWVYVFCGGECLVWMYMLYNMCMCM